MDEHVSRILKMLEEGKISASEAEKLLSALRTDPQATAGATSGSASGGSRWSESRPGAPSSPPPPPPPGAPPSSPPPPPPGDSGSAKSFEFRWSHRRGLGLDLSNLGKQISDAVRKIDPERIARDARGGWARGGRRWQERMRNWFGEDEDGRPENTLGQPMARDVESKTFDVIGVATLQIENNWGAITIIGGNDTVMMEIEREAWATTEEAAWERLRELKVETSTFTSESGTTRLETRVSAPEGWRDGTVNLRLRVPESTILRLATVFGEVRVENIAGKVELQTVSGSVSLENLRGEVRAEGISGDMRATHIDGPLQLAGKSGDLHVEQLSRGGAINSVSGDVHVSHVEGGRLEAKSVSGDVTVENIGQQVPLDITVESVSGDVRLAHARGNIALKAVSGDLSGQHLDAVTLQSQTVSGDVELLLDTAFLGTLTTNTVSGDVTIEMPRSSNFRFTLSTQSGDLHSGHTVQDANRTETLWSGTVGTGAGTVTVQTLSGDVHLNSPE